MANVLQASRTELKFTVDEQVAAGIKQYLGATLRRDTNGAGCGPHGYPVCSVYLDNQRASLYGQTIEGFRNRYKLRVRIYDRDSSHPAFLEIKRRDGQIIKKQRATITRDAAQAILAGAPATPDRLTGASKKDWYALQEFTRLRDSIGAVGTTYVCYYRDAYVSPQGVDWRATFDRKLSARTYRLGQPITIPDDSVPTEDFDKVIFELKFTDRFPHWMRDLVRTFNLNVVSFPKYINCADALGWQTRRSVASRRMLRGHAPATTFRVAQ